MFQSTNMPPIFHTHFNVNPTYVKQTTEDESLLEQPGLFFENHLDGPLQIFYGDFYFKGSHSCGNVRGELLLPGHEMDRKLVLQLAEYISDAPCRILDPKEVTRNLSRLPSPNTRITRSLAALTLADDEDYGREEEQVMRVLDQKTKKKANQLKHLSRKERKKAQAKMAQNAERQVVEKKKKKFLNQDQTVEYSFNVYLWTMDQDLWLDEPSHTQKMTGEVTIPRGSPKDFCIHYSIV